MPALLRGPQPATSRGAGLLEVLLARAASDDPWLVFHHGKKSEPFTWRAAVGLAQGWAAAFAAAGVKDGARVALLLPNGPDFVGAFFGAQLIGATPVPMPWPVAEAGIPKLPAGAEAVLAVAEVSAIAAPKGLEGVAVPVVSGPIAGEVATVASSAPAFIQFTSGSTGTPRGAVIPRSAALASASAMVEGLKLGPADVGVSWLPLFHDMGLVGVLMSSLVAGMRVHMMRPAELLLHPWRWLELCSEVKATLTVAPNFGYELLLRRGKGPAGLDLSALRAMLNGSEPVLRRTLDAFEDRYAPAGLKKGSILPVYGLAENTLGVTFQALGAPDPDLSIHDRSVPSAGQPIAGMEVAVRRPDGTLAEEGEEGEITVGGPAVMSGYFRNEEATAKALRNGALWTGDRGVIKGGRLYITGREKELIIKAGRKYHPADIERIVGAVADSPANGVAAFSVVSEQAGGEQLVVVVELRRQPTDDVTQRIRGKLAEELGVTADRIELVGAGDLPRTTSGKLKRSECIARYGSRA